MISLNPQDQGTIVLPQEDYVPLAVESLVIDRKAQSVSPDTLSPSDEAQVLPGLLRSPGCDANITADGRPDPWFHSPTWRDAQSGWRPRLLPSLEDLAALG